MAAQRAGTQTLNFPGLSPDRIQSLESNDVPLKSDLSHTS